jgi:peptidoglycan hydrolase-like protein with peptidoglycan-binding domain
MTRPHFNFEPFEFRKEKQAWEHERRRSHEPLHSARDGWTRASANRTLPATTRFDQPSGPCACPAHGTEFVRWVQSTLNNIDNANLPVDGMMNAAVRNALRRFQRHRRLPADGIAGPETEQALRKARERTEPRPEPAPDASDSYEFATLDFEPLTSTPTLRNGSRGATVIDLQRRLATAGFSPGVADGIFGSHTDAAVRSFQRARGLSVDGIVGPQTWGALLGTSSNVPSADTPPPQPAVATPIAWGARVTPAFRARVRQIAARFAVDPGDLMSVMAFESGETFSPAIRNKLSGATGLIQFMPTTARSLGTTTDALAAMTAEAQLDYVERYFARQKQPLRTLEDLYMAVLWPPAIGQPNATPIFLRGDARTGVAYDQNRGLDSNNDGRITKAEAAAFVRAKRAKGDQVGYAG